MTLLSFITQLAVQNTLRRDYPKLRLTCNIPTPAPPLTTSYALVGTAFGYLLRFRLERLNQQAAGWPWIAEESLSSASSILKTEGKFLTLGMHSVNILSVNLCFICR